MLNTTLTYQFKAFQDLSADELYELLQLRSEVFVVEQNCPYQDLDNKDQLAIHLMGRNKENKLLACSRILPPGVSYPEPSIGRVVVKAEARKKQLGKELMQQSRVSIIFWGVQVKQKVFQV